MDEIDFTRDQIQRMNLTHRCVKCERGRLWPGPQGGCSINARCDVPECGQEYCLAVLGGVVHMGSFIARNEPSLYDRRRTLWPSDAGPN